MVKPITDWTYKEAFRSHRGVISPAQQTQLRDSRVAIAGMGGAGGIDLVTLARLGVGHFTIADPDRFELANTNRQYGANVWTLGRLKSQVMAEVAKNINPDAEVWDLSDAIGRHNVNDFFDGCDLFVEAIDFFEIEQRRILLREAANRGIWAITAGPVGFGGIWIVFDPAGVSFDECLGVTAGMEHREMLAAFVQLVTGGKIPPYIDLSCLNLADRVGPSSGLACNIAAAGMACEAMRLLTGVGGVKSAPHVHGFDPYN